MHHPLKRTRSGGRDAGSEHRPPPLHSTIQWGCGAIEGHSEYTGKATINEICGGIPAVPKSLRKFDGSHCTLRRLVLNLKYTTMDIAERITNCIKGSAILKH